MSTHLSEFEKLKEFYPGSNKEIVRKPRKVVRESLGWDNNPRILQVAGEQREFFTIGNLAHALSRRPVTIRTWEAKGIIPKPTFRKPSEDPRGSRRLYTRAQIEGMVRIANEEGLLKGDNRSITQTDFTARVISLFRELAAQ